MAGWSLLIADRAFAVKRFQIWARADAAKARRRYADGSSLGELVEQGERKGREGGSDERGTGSVDRFIIWAASGIPNGPIGAMQISASRDGPLCDFLRQPALDLRGFFKPPGDGRKEAQNLFGVAAGICCAPIGATGDLWAGRGRLREGLPNRGSRESREGAKKTGAESIRGWAVKWGQKYF